MAEIDTIIGLLLALNPRTAFEVVIRTGWPIASTLAEKGKIKISGCDISGNLILKTKEKYPEMELFVGDIWNAV